MRRRRRPASLDRRAASACAAVIAVLVLAASPAAARVVKANGHVYGIVATTAAPPPSAAACIAASDCTALTYHGGLVMHAERFTFLYWTPPGHAVPSAYRSGLATWLSEIAAKDYTAGDVFSVDQQYYDQSGPGGARRFVPYGITSGGTKIDTTPYPAGGCTAGTVCLTDAQLRSELASYVSAHSLPTGPATVYFVFTPVNVSSCLDATAAQCSYTQFCGYHSSIGTAGASTEILYADMPWEYKVNGCDTDLAFGTGYPNGDAIDPVVGILSHEASGAMTDPNANAWFDASGYEDGDKCAFVYGSGGFGSLAGLPNNGLGYYNATFGTDQYLMQFEFDQRVANCAGADSDTQPTVHVSPATATHGVATTFTAIVTAPPGVSTVSWNFGDGTGTALTTATTRSHTYATAGTKSLTVIVTDNHGNEKRVVQTVTVS